MLNDSIFLWELRGKCSLIHFLQRQYFSRYIRIFFADPKPTSPAKGTRFTSTGSNAQSSSKIVSTTSGIAFTTHSGTSQPDKSFDLCYSTTIENLTHKNIEETMCKLGKYIN